ncbi:MAG: toxin-antitoxin system YwqK family antitoxin, partial [Flavobacteriales bacterium]
YLFSTYFEDDWKTPKEGVCEITYNGLAMERRAFHEGRLTEELARYPDGSMHIQTVFYTPSRKDSTLVDQKVWSENKSLHQHDIYYRDKQGRRCVHQQGFHIDGVLRFDRYFAFVRRDELNEYQVKDHPDHVVDAEGYTTLMAPIGPERWYDNKGAIETWKTHRPILRDGKPYTYSLPLEYSLHGPTLNYYPNGVIYKRANYQDGELSGECTSFYPSGKKQSVGFYENGVPDSLWTAWYEDGSVKSVYRYELLSQHPFLPSKQEWWPNGTRKLEELFDDEGSGVSMEWAENGQRIHQVDIVRMHRDVGAEWRWFENGQVQLFADFRKDADTIRLEYHNPEGLLKQLRLRSAEGNSTTISQWDYALNGQLEREVIKRSTEWSVSDVQWEMDEKTYYPAGTMKRYSMLSNREQCYEDYAQNGIKIKSRRLLDQQLNGPYEELDSLGQIRLHGEYRHGVRDGWWRYYNAAQALEFERLYHAGVPADGSLEEYAKRLRKTLSNESLQWAKEMLEGNLIGLDTSVKAWLDEAKLETYLARLHQGLMGADWLLEMAEQGKGGDRNYYRNMGLQLLISAISPGVMRFQIGGWGESITITMYADGEMEEYLRAQTLLELNQKYWQQTKGMWWD